MASENNFPPSRLLPQCTTCDTFLYFMSYILTNTSLFSTETSSLLTCQSALSVRTNSLIPNFMLRPCSSLAHYFSETWHLWQASNQIPRLKTLISRSIHAQKKKKIIFQNSLLHYNSIILKISKLFEHEVLWRRPSVTGTKAHRFQSDKQGRQSKASIWIFAVTMDI